MDTAVQSYYTRFWKRLRKDATPWARDNIFWGAIVLVVPAIAIYVSNRHAAIDWGLIKTTLVLYAFSFCVYVFVHVCRTPKKLDDERSLREMLLNDKIQEREEKIGRITSTSETSESENAILEILKHRPNGYYEVDELATLLRLSRRKAWDLLEGLEKKDRVHSEKADARGGRIWAISDLEL